MENKFLESLEWRYATKVFDKNKKISENDLQTLLDALVLTSSSF
jgi:nitroreductase